MWLANSVRCHQSEHRTRTGVDSAGVISHSVKCAIAGLNKACAWVGWIGV
jgi:hypothetical protein